MKLKPWNIEPWTQESTTWNPKNVLTWNYKYLNLEAILLNHNKAPIPMNLQSKQPMHLEPMKSIINFFGINAIWALFIAQTTIFKIRIYGIATHKMA